MRSRSPRWSTCSPTSTASTPQIAALDHQLDEIAAQEPWVDPVRWLCCFRGITTLTALALLAELGDFRRFGSAGELMGFLGLTPSEYSSGEQPPRPHHQGRQHPRPPPAHRGRLALPARPRVSQRIAAGHPDVPPDVAARAYSAQIRLHHRHRTLTAHGKRSTVANVAVARRARRLPVGRHNPPAPPRPGDARRRRLTTHPTGAGLAGADPLEEPRPELCDSDPRP
jgi:hypothetical protein